MHSRFFLAAISLMISFNSFPQTQLSLYTQRMLKHASHEKTTIDLFVRGDFDKVKKAVLEAGGNYKFGHGKYSSVTVPLNQLEAFLANPFIQGVESGEMPIVPLMDTARMVNCILPLHNGEAPFDTAYTGNGVIMGIIDYGIDFNHTDFKKPNGDTRILYLWDQNVSNFNAPLPYNYGREWHEAEINAGQCTHQESLPGHGTNAAGIAAGNGRACNGIYTGVAPNSDLIVVAFNFNQPFLSTFMDAVDYIFRKADTLGKPCVVNASLGAYWGSHDGIDPAGQLVDSLLQEKSGRVLVCAAGNAGNRYFHLGYDVTTDTSFTWFTFNNQFQDVYFDFWADTQDFNNVSFAIGVDNPSTWRNLQKSGFFSIPDDYVFNTSGVASNNFQLMDSAGSIVLGDVATTVILTEGRYNLAVHVTNINNPGHYWSFLTSGSGKFDGWNIADPTLAIYSSDMVRINLPDSVTRPDIVNYKFPDLAKTTVSSFTCSDKVITVGNFYNRAFYLDVDSNLVATNEPPGIISPASSRGPTRDERIKPDISATGSTTMATGLGAQTSLSLGNANRNRVGLCGQYYRNGGTSMASPVVAGVVALYLEMNPNANWEEVKAAITGSARSDSFTGVVPNNTYGYGKVSACGAILSAYGCTDVTAINYNPDALIDDGSCIIPGCTDSTATNYNPSATVDDGSCIIPGCTDSTATNYNPNATVDDGSCIISGCTDSTATNYNPNATVDDGSCIIPGCTDSSATNYNPNATIDDGSCIIPGCTDSTATNYNPSATVDDGSCLYVGISRVGYNGNVKLIFIPNFLSLQADQIRIVYDLADLSGRTSIVITNLLGQRMDEITLKEKTGEISYKFRARAPGIYFYHLLHTQKVLLSGKIVIHSN